MEEEIYLDAVEEIEFSFRDEEYLVNGRVDAILSGRYSGKPTQFIVDWKTGKGDLKNYINQAYKYFFFFF